VAPQKDEIMSIRDAVSIPILIGSGLDVNNLSDILPLTDGAVVGSAFKEGGELSSPVDKQKVKIFMQKVNDIREKIS
jgi:predicted TIM-barrel enzyme